MTRWAVVKPAKKPREWTLVSHHDTKTQADAALEAAGNPKGWRVAEMEWAGPDHRPAGKVD